MKRFLSGAVLALSGLSAGAAEFQLLILETPAELAKRSDSGPAGQAYWASYGQYGQALQAAGVVRGGGALQPAAAGRSVGAGGARPQALTAHASGAQLGGWFIIDVADLDSALAWAARAPSVATGGSVEVRPLAPVPGMAR